MHNFYSFGKLTEYKYVVELILTRIRVGIIKNKPTFLLYLFSSLFKFTVPVESCSVISINSNTYFLLKAASSCPNTGPIDQKFCLC